MRRPVLPASTLSAMTRCFQRWPSAGWTICWIALLIRITLPPIAARPFIPWPRLQRLASNSHLTEQQRQALLEGVVGGIDQILATIHNDPDLLVQKAGIIAEKGVDPQAGPARILGRKRIGTRQAATVGADGAEDVRPGRPNRDSPAPTIWPITSPAPTTSWPSNGKKPTTWPAWRRTKRRKCSTPWPSRSIPPIPSAGDSIQESLKSFERWDNPDSGVQPQVRLLMAKLNVLGGDKDDIAKAKQMIDALVKNPDNQISPAPAPELIFEALCYSVIASLSANDLPGAQTALDDAKAYQQAHFAHDPEQAGALRLLEYRLLALHADQAPPGSEKDAANAAAVNALAKLVTDFPGLRDAIYRQLAARLPANPDPAKLDPMLLLALVEQGRQQVVGTPASADKAKLQLAPLGGAGDFVALFVGFISRRPGG